MSWAVIAVLVAGLLAGCSEPPPPSEETEALESSLLTLADIGGDFAEEYRGPMGASGGGVCPESDFEFEDVGMVRASFVWSLDGDDEVGLVEMLRVGEPGELDTLLPALKTAFEACSGVVWTDYGQTQTVEVMEFTEVGDDRLAVHARHGEPPFDGRHDDIRTVYVRSGDIFAEISIAEPLDTADDRLSVSDMEFERIVSQAVARLPT
jgi:hypothetical protein